MIAPCAHCELPTPLPRGHSEDEVYCCVGCRIAAMASDGNGARGLLEARLVFAAFLTMGVMTFTTLLYSHEFLAEGGEEGLDLVRDAGRLALVFFALPVLALLAPPLARGAWADARRGVLRMDGLIVIAVAAAFVLSLVNTWRGAGEVYFETATMVLVLVTLGRRLEARAREAGRDAAEALARELPEIAHRVASDDIHDVPIDELDVGDVCDIHPGETVPADGVVVAGRGSLVAAHVTGEADARDVDVGDTIVAGAINGPTSLQMRVTGRWTSGPLGRIRDLLARAAPSSQRQRRIDRLARVLAALAIALALAAGGFHAMQSDLGSGVSAALSVLLVACPCALGLAIPLADRAMRVALARRGLLVHDGEALETVLHCDELVLDKTGTLTQTNGRWTTCLGNLKDVTDVATLVARSGHALQHAVPDQLRLAHAQVGDVELVPGRGVVGRVNGRHVIAGHPDYVAGTRSPEIDQALSTLDDLAGSAIVGAVDGVVVAVIRIDHPLRSSARGTLTRLTARGLRPSLLSGDRRAAVAALAADLEIDARGDCSPDDKLATVEALQRDGRHVLMVGDGVNDAPVMRAADVGVAMGSGTAAAKRGADVEIVSDDLALLDDFIAAAHDLARVVRGNLTWTLIYNAAALTAAATGRLSPPLAAVAMIVSSMVVAWRSAALLEWTPARQEERVLPISRAREPAVA